MFLRGNQQKEFNMKVVIYGKPNCPYCDKAKALMLELSMEFDYIDIVQAKMGKEELSLLAGKPVTTVPQIYIDDKHIGGYDQLVAELNKAEAEDPTLDYYVREIGEGGWVKSTFAYYVLAQKRPELDSKTEPK